MKSFITILAAVMLTASSFATPPGSTRLSIINTDNKNLRVVIDGNRYDGIGNNLSLANITMGHHNIRIYQVKRGFFFRRPPSLLFLRFLKPDRQISLVVKRDGDVVINEQYNRYPDRNDRGRDGRYDKDNDRYDRDQDRYGKDDRRNNGYPRF